MGGFFGGGGAGRAEPYLTTVSSATLSGERVLLAGTNIALTLNTSGDPDTITISSTGASGSPLADPQYITLAVASALTNERIFTPGTGLSAVDGGAGAAYTLNLPQTVSSAATPTFSRLTLTQATGTAPLSVSSTTLVTNLNADLLDGVQASQFALLSGRTGGQVLTGGTAAGDDLTLRTTSDGTKGTLILNDDGGGVQIGTAALAAGFVTARLDQSVGTYHRIQNNVNGVSAGVGLVLDTTAGFSQFSRAAAVGNLGLSGILNGETFVASDAVGLALYTAATVPLRAVVGGVERWRTLSSSPNTIQGNAGLTIEGGAGVHTLTLSGGAGVASTIAVGAADELLSFFAVAAVARASATNDIKDALTAYGLLQGTSATPLDLDGGALTTGAASFGTSATLRQTTANYTVTWVDPAAARNISIPDPLGTDVFVFRDMAQTLLSKTLTAPDINAGTADSLTSLSIRSTGSAFDLELRTTTAYTANRLLRIELANNADSLITVTGSQIVLDDWFNQSVKTTSNPTFATLTISGALNHDGTTVGLYGVAPVVRSTGWTITNDGADRTFDANATSIDELADVVATLIRDVAATGLIGAVA